MSTAVRHRSIPLCWYMFFFTMVLVVIGSYFTVHKLDLLHQVVFVSPDKCERAQCVSLLGRRAATKLIVATANRWHHPTETGDAGGFGCHSSPLGYPWMNSSHLPRRITRAEHWKMLHLLDTADWLLSMGNFSYIMYGGTLLGSFLFHDLIPWDEDVDILVPHSEKQRLVSYLKQYGRPEYDVTHLYAFSKFHTVAGERASKSYKWTWPYLDIGYYGENSSHIWEVYRAQDESRIFPKHIVFPFHLRPLAGHWFSAPNDSYAFMKIMLSAKDKKGHLITSKLPKFKCALDAWDHRKEKFRKGGQSTDCANILPFYPVVHTKYRESEAGQRGVSEILTINGSTVLQECFVDEPSYAMHRRLSFELLSEPPPPTTHSTTSQS